MDFTAIAVSIISGIITVLTVVLNSQSTRSAITSQLQTHQAVTDEKIETLTREVRKHNNFAERIPVIEEQIKVANHRIEDLERR